MNILSITHTTLVQRYWVEFRQPATTWLQGNDRNATALSCCRSRRIFSTNHYNHSGQKRREWQCTKNSIETRAMRDIHRSYFVNHDFFW
jgi:hypothetical protein